MNKNEFAKTPPMGWNSYDYYDTRVTEADVKANADYMAKHLKEYGWEYVVVDIEWYAHGAGSQRDQFQYIPFSELEMDEYSRLLPCPDRFPSAANGNGFKPLADYVHSLGLKFGIHIMRGIPRIAAHNHTKLLGTTQTANCIADAANICFWNPDMYGVDTRMPEAQLYYDSLFQLYADWGVDFVKCDDICRMDMASARTETIMLQNAIQKSGRSIVLSLSPGPAKLDQAWLYEKYANMWRITDDFWDDWKLLLNMFDRCEQWEKHVSEGCYPDCDMLPLGKIGMYHDSEHDTKLTRDEQVTMMTLWSIFRSPMMLGAELPKLDDWTLSLLTNKDVLRLLFLQQQARQIDKDPQKAIWVNEDLENQLSYIALFNLTDTEATIEVSLSQCMLQNQHFTKATELWSKQDIPFNGDILSATLPAHGAKLVCYSAI